MFVSGPVSRATFSATRSSCAAFESRIATRSGCAVDDAALAKAILDDACVLDHLGPDLLGIETEQFGQTAIDRPEAIRVLGCVQ